MSRDLDIDFEEPIDSDFKESIKDVTAKIILSKIEYPVTLHDFKLRGELTNKQVNIARFMMEGLGFPSKYWLCTGIETLQYIMKHNMCDDHYNELIRYSDRKDVLNLRGLPLFYTSDGALGDCLLLVSDVKKKTIKITNFVPYNFSEDAAAQVMPVDASGPSYGVTTRVYNDDIPF